MQKIHLKLGWDDEAQSSIYVIDNYIGLKTLVLLKDVVARVDVTVFSDNLGKGLHKAEYDDFCKEYGSGTKALDLDSLLQKLLISNL